MAKGITFATWEEAREYIDRKKREGYETSFWIDEATGKYKVAITPVYFKAPPVETAPRTLREEAEEEEGVEEEKEEEKEKTEETEEMPEEIETKVKELLKRSKRKRLPARTFKERQAARQAKRYGVKLPKVGKVLAKPPEEYPERIRKKVVVPAARYALRDIQKGLKEAKAPPDVRAGMIAAIPPKPYTAGKHPRIGIEGAIGMGVPRIGIVRGISISRGSMEFPKLKNASVPPKAAGFQAPRSRIAQLTPLPKPVYPYFKSKKEREEEKEE